MHSYGAHWELIIIIIIIIIIMMMIIFIISIAHFLQYNQMHITNNYNNIKIRLKIRLIYIVKITIIVIDELSPLASTY